jgi:hypothetical protein
MQRVKIVEPQPDVEALCMSIEELVEWRGCLGIQVGARRYMLVTMNDGSGVLCFGFSRPRHNLTNYTYASAKAPTELLGSLSADVELYRFESEAELMVWLAEPHLATKEVRKEI